MKLPADYDVTTLVCDACGFFKIWCHCGGESWTSLIYGDHFEGYETPPDIPNDTEHWA